MPKIKIRHMKMKDEPKIKVRIFRDSFKLITVNARINNINIYEKISVIPRDISQTNIYPISCIENLHMNKYLHRYLGAIYRVVRNMQVGTSQTIEVSKYKNDFEDLGPVSYNKR